MGWRSIAVARMCTRSFACAGELAYHNAKIQLSQLPDALLSTMVQSVPSVGSSPSSNRSKAQKQPSLSGRSTSSQANGGVGGCRTITRCALRPS